ncbi:Ligand-binding domain of nuclear hormone receptor [Ancylostoma duodenale]|uniref:Ligand-binding domain of nuclear hormone receptor n=1 Tax=Ancylostoma duodenale TaxID=51022 RepID=A0A0C2CF20_9BILA|nr:Ligand-binding domain of nuclear hormone receptor [Ancylostoma duodenale]
MNPRVHHEHLNFPGFQSFILNSDNFNLRFNQNESAVIHYTILMTVMTIIEKILQIGLSSASVSFINAFYNPNMISPRTPLVITAERVATMKDVMQDWRRNFVLFADWLHALPEFASLSVDDQILIAKSRFGPFYWWMCANWTNEANCDGVCYANGTYFPRAEALQCFPDVRGCSDRMVVTLSEPLRELQLDETEKSLMLAVIVFSDEPLELSVSGKEHVKSMGHRFVRMLHHHIRNREPSLSNAAIALRIAKIMILLTATTFFLLRFARHCFVRAVQVTPH